MRNLKQVQSLNSKIIVVIIIIYREFDILKDL